MKNFARVIISEAKRRKILQKEIAKELGLDPSLLSQWVSADKPKDLSPATLDRMVNKLKSNPEFLERLMKAYMRDKFAPVYDLFEIEILAKDKSDRVQEDHPEPAPDIYASLANAARKQQISKAIVDTLIEIIEKIPQSKWMRTALRGLGKAPQ